MRIRMKNGSKCQKMSECRPHPDKIDHRAIFRTLFMDADTDTDTWNSDLFLLLTEIALTIFNLFHFYPDTDVRGYRY